MGFFLECQQPARDLFIQTQGSVLSLFFPAPSIPQLHFTHQPRLVCGDFFVFCSFFLFFFDSSSSSPPCSWERYEKEKDFSELHEYLAQKCKGPAQDITTAFPGRRPCRHYRWAVCGPAGFSGNKDPSRRLCSSPWFSSVQGTFLPGFLLPHCVGGGA